jgi:hypothetical protein
LISLPAAHADRLLDDLFGFSSVFRRNCAFDTIAEALTQPVGLDASERGARLSDLRPDIDELAVTGHDFDSTPFATRSSPGEGNVRRQKQKAR